MYSCSAERIDWMLNEEVRAKKSTANGARHRKRGSKSKKCNLSTDGMTRKQWLERCGEIMTYNMNKPMVWDEFIKLPTHIQKEYLTGLVEKYSATASDLGKMFGANPREVSSFCKQDEIGIHFSPGKRMNKEQREAFEAFLYQDKKEIVEDVSADNPIDVSKDVPMEDKREESCPVIDIDNTKASGDMAMTEFKLTFDGKFNRDMLYNSIISMIPKGTKVKMEIKCDIET